MLLQMAMDGAADGLTIAEFKEFISNIYDSVVLWIWIHPAYTGSDGGRAGNKTGLSR